MLCGMQATNLSALAMIGGGLGGLVSLALLGLLVWSVVRWQRAGGPALAVNGSGGAPPPSATEILRERYARGDIDLATFEEMVGHVYDGTSSLL